MEEKKPEKSKKSEEKDAPFVWETGTRLEKISFVTSLATLVVAIVFLVFEFIYEAEKWPYSWFNIAISLSFLSEGFLNIRRKRTFAIIAFVCGSIFLIVGLLNLLGVF